MEWSRRVCTTDPQAIFERAVRTQRKVFGERPPARLLLRPSARPECQIADHAGRVVEPDTATVELPAGRRFINREGSIQHVLAADIEKEIAEVVVSIGPRRAIVIEDAVYPALGREPATARFRCGEPGETLTR